MGWLAARGLAVRRSAAWLLVLGALVVGASGLHAAPVDMAVMGDSLNLLSTYYDISWVAQLRNAGAITPHDQAVDGAESGDVVRNQLPQVLSLVQQGMVTDSALVVGANDIALEPDNLRSIFLYDPQPVIDSIVGNIETVISSIRSADPNVHQVIANIPDITVTPYFQSYLNGSSLTPEQLQAGRTAIMDINSQIEQYALTRGIPVVDLFTAADVLIPLYPWTFGGHTFNTAFSYNGLDIQTQPEGLISNMMAMAFNEAYGQNLPIFSDQQIVTTAGFTPNTDTTYYDVSPLVLLPAPEPATLVLAAFVRSRCQQSGRGGKRGDDLRRMQNGV